MIPTKGIVIGLEMVEVVIEEEAVALDDKAILLDVQELAGDGLFILGLFQASIERAFEVGHELLDFGAFQPWIVINQLALIVLAIGDQASGSDLCKFEIVHPEQRRESAVIE